MKPIVSIITPSFNSARTIEATLASVAAQTFAEWEMLVVDDCSTDESPAIVARASAADSRIRLLRTARNGGPAMARNVALEAVRGDFVAFLDSDDLWLPSKLERQLQFMRETGAAVSYTAYRRTDRDGVTTGHLIEVPARVTYEELLKHNVIACLTAMVDVRQTGPLALMDERHEDYILWLSLLRRGYVARGLCEDLARYRVVPGSVSRNRLRGASWVWNIHRNVEGLPLWKAVWCFGHYAVNASLKHRVF